MRHTAIAAALSVFSCVAAAADIIRAWYDSPRDEIVAEIVYRGTHPNHEFSLDWDACRKPVTEGGPYQAAARIIDSDGNDAARMEYRVKAGFDLKTLDCRPAMVTLRLGRVAHQTLYIPASQ